MPEKQDLNLKNPLRDYLERMKGKGNTVVNVASDKEAVWLNYSRDMAKAWTLLSRSAMNATFAAVHGHEKKEEYCDYISKTMLAIYTSCSKDNITGLDLFRQLCEYITEEGEEAAEVFHLYTMMFHQMYFTYIFTTTHTALGNAAPKDQLEDYTLIAGILSTLEPDLKKQVVTSLRENFVWPGQVNAKPLVEEMEPFIQIAKEDREINKKRMEERTKSQEESADK